jgi:nitrite reductase/ring-hydroxylating ferredoxin subunit
VAPGSQLGDFLRQFWLPICPTADLPQGAARPVRAQLLDERLVAFRDGEGRLGLIYGLCPHARGDMFFSSIDNDGIRCNYHGWKFDVNGVCLETPMHPDGFGIDTIAYSVAEHDGLIWGFFGAGEPPSLPKLSDGNDLKVERRTRPWMDTILSELLSSTDSPIDVERDVHQVRVLAAGTAVASFALPGVVTHPDANAPTFVLPATEKASAVLGGAADPSASEHEHAAAVRDAIENMLREAMAQAS